jgi:hypothetical protein
VVKKPSRRSNPPTSPREVVQFYQTKLQECGFKIEVASSGEQGGMIQAQDAKKKANADPERQPRGNRNAVAIGHRPEEKRSAAEPSKGVLTEDPRTKITLVAV